ncbi:MULTISPECIES: mechanosensitive ion channel [Planktothricoides]|uniref:Mechanosensitive ion channel n=2 Tax=Planktothricoides raciborskii TaxID=132608 RepID=A0AAU8JF35_9CYAN|nr:MULTISPECIES: mechanosensitive ion channel [Planktothricoides]KOR33912.1 hypothetical protein AM228_27030 [Planktothricoides sp. SR001]MBD2545148.1 mechanosensitive ion channel [Planktothricoides raciborskii FACHB-1370]MBD2583323.1 mechanosensitive ion channel [Planktothricoides raciborskii FACHB-1261]
MNEILQITRIPESGLRLGSNLLLAQENAVSSALSPVTSFFQKMGEQVGSFLPSLIGAIAILLVGWMLANALALGTKKLLDATEIDNWIAAKVLGRQPNDPKVPIEKWVSQLVFWVIMIFALVAFFNVLNLDIVSQPLNSFLQQIFNYLPKIGGAVVILGVAWIVATMTKAIVTHGLQSFHLDDRLAEQTGGEQSPFSLNETLANAMYWFVFLFFLPLVLDALQLQGPLQPVQNLLDTILSALPKILTAVIIGAIGWFIAWIVRRIITNVLAAMGTDQIASKMGLTQTDGGMSLSGLIGTLVYVLILIPTAIAALNALQIEAISAPAVSMLQQILNTIPQIFTAALIFAVFYAIGQFISELVAKILASLGFNNIFQWLGLPTVSPSDNASNSETISVNKTPSEIAGIVVQVGIMLFAAVAASEVLGMPALTQIAQGILQGSGNVLVGLLVFGIGLYLANLAFTLISGAGGANAKILGNSARISIIALSGAMALQQMGIATDIVNLAFGLLLGAIAVAVAIAFGLGGRDVAAEQLRQWLSTFKDNDK